MILKVAGAAVGMTIAPWCPAQVTPRDAETSAILILAAPADLADAPDDLAHSTMRLGVGSRLRVRARLEGGWVEVDPPPGVVDWIRADDLETLDDDRARVRNDRAAIRTGRPGAILPGPIKLRLDRGTLVRRVPSATLGDPSWTAILPPTSDRRYVKLQRATNTPTQPAELRNQSLGPQGDDRPLAARTPRIGFRVASDSGTPPNDRLDDNASIDIDTGLATLDARYRAILARPMYAWSFEDVEARYKSALDATDDPARRLAIERRLATIARQKTLAESARMFQDALESSQRRQEELRAATREAFRQVQSERFAAVGELYPSDKQRAGTRLLALFDPNKGGVTAYLALPPGMRADRWISRTVGVEGAISFDSDLNARVIDVTDLEPLDER